MKIFFFFLRRKRKKQRLHLFFPNIDGVRTPLSLEKEKQHFFSSKKLKAFFSLWKKFLSLESFLDCQYREKRMSRVFFGISIFSFSSLGVLLFFLVLHTPNSIGATYQWNQTSWSVESADLASHPDDGNWNKYQSKDTNLFAGDTLELIAQPSSSTRTSDTHFSAGTFAETGISGSGDMASVGLLSALGLVSQVEANYFFSCALKTDGTVYCWGRNQRGNLGNDTQKNTYAPTQVLGVGGSGFLTDISNISLGWYHACAVKHDGTAYCWGDNNYGQLGDNTETDRFTPVQVHGVDDVGSLTDIANISAGNYHTCATKTDGSAYCWGNNNNGQLGDNTDTDRSTPVQVHGVDDVGSLTDIAGVSAGGYHTCATKTDGSAYCWGRNNSGQLGDNTDTDRSTPVQVHSVDGSGFLTDIAGISLGWYHTCATKTDGSAYCWGDNYNGKLGDNTTTDRSTPVQVHGVDDVGHLTDTSGISAGYAHTCATKTDGTSYCWGDNYNGKLGDNTETDRSTPVQVHGVDDVGYLTDTSGISVGYAHTCASGNNGSAYCWGANVDGALGDNTGESQNTPVQVVESTNFLNYFDDAVETLSGNSHTCSLRTDGTVWCWGRNSRGQLGDGTTTDHRTPVQVHGVDDVGYLTDIANISAGDFHTCAVKNEGTAYCWGDNNYGKLGDNTTTDRSTPVQVHGVDDVGHLTDIANISAGNHYSHTCATTTDGSAYCWGRNNSGQLGDNTTADTLTPVRVVESGGGFLNQLENIRTSGDSTCALKTNGTVWCWGRGSYGALGAGLSEASSVPVQVKNAGLFSDSIADAQSMDSYDDTSCILRDDSTVWCWGANEYGQIGDGTNSPKPGAVQVKGVGGSGYLTDISQIAGGNQHTCALKTDGTAYCWGSNYYGKLGDNTTTNRSTPVQVHGVDDVGSLTDIANISAGNSHTCATKTDGSAYCWGYNNSGRLGDNTTTNRSTPVQVHGVDDVGSLTDIANISAGNSHTCATKTDGSAYCWGYNNSGRLGDNTTTNRSTPVQVHG